MSETRRRRVGSESEPLIVIEPSYDKHEGKLKNYSNQNSNKLDTMPPLKNFNPIITTARDRTMEFAKLIQTLQTRNVKRSVNLHDMGTRNGIHMQRHAEFMMIAKTIGRNVAGTYAKLEKLTMLASNKSLIKDQPIEIQELTYIIREDISSLNQQIGKLQELARHQKEKRRHLASHTSNVVLGLQTKLANMTTEFKQVLEVRTENLRHQKSRREQYVSEPSAPVERSSRQSNLLVPDEVSIELDGGRDNAMVPLLQSQMVSYDQTDDYLQTRADAMQNIESTIVELGGIFQQLAHLVKEQEEMVERIDSNVDDIGLNVDLAHTEIVKYFKSVSSNRKLMIKVFGILIVFFIIFVVFMT